MQIVIITNNKCSNETSSVAEFRTLKYCNPSNRSQKTNFVNISAKSSILLSREAYILKKLRPDKLQKAH